MWPKALARRLGVEYPILLAPMAGGPGTPELAAAVSEAGALGSIAAGYLEPEAIRAAIRQVRRRTARPFAVNLFSPEAGAAPQAEAVARPDFPAQLAVVLEERVPVFSFAFGALPGRDVRSLHERGAVVLGTATTVREALALEASGVDAVVAQGAEAGGHHSTFAVSAQQASIGTIALVPQVVGALKVPVVAAGGIMDGRGLVAVFALGAAAAQMGTAFLACDESGADPSQKAALLAGGEHRGARPAALPPGRVGRASAHRFLVDVERAGAILPYPAEDASSAGASGPVVPQAHPGQRSLWAGQGAPLARAKGAGELVRDLVEQAERIVKSLR